MSGFSSTTFSQRRWRASGAAGVCAVLWLAGAIAVAAPAGGNEARALEEAKQSFAQGFWKQAEAQFAGFARNYPESAHVREVVLWQAQARVRLRQQAEAVDLLEKHLVRAGPLEGEYRFWRAEAEMQRGNQAGAAKAWAELLRLFPNYRDALQAAYKEAFAHFALGELERAVQLLQGPDGHFHRLSAARTNDQWTVRGRLLHAEIALAGNDPSGAGAILAQLPATELTPEQQWQRRYLEARMLLAQDKPAEALAQATNLVATAPPSQALAQAQSVALQAEVFERLGQIEAAVQAYTNNLSRAIPAEFRQQALLRLVALLEAQNRTDSAISHLEAHAGDADMLVDLYRLTLGELRLKKYYQLGTDSAPAAGDHAAVRSNLLEQAYADFIHATNSVRGAWAGRAELGRGWCLWEQRKLVESAQAFAAAAEKLPPSPEQAMARFKLGDARFGLEQFEAAVESYEAILREYRDRQTTDSLFDQALYQIVNSSVAAGNLEAASRALRRILEWFPETFFAEQTTMWVGQGFRRLQQPAEARGYFEKFTARFPESPLRADAALAIAQTYAQETNWMAASAELDRWVGQFTNHAKLPDAEFERAWVYYQAGRETNTFPMYTNFLARFPTNELAPRAMKWIGDYYRRAGDLKGAEESYQILYQNTNWPPSLLTYQARLLAGGTALMRQGFAEAREYFNWIINSGPPIVPNSPIPPEVVAEAYFALGSAILNGPSPGATNVIEQYQQAVNAFSKIPRLFPSDRLVPQALARLGFLHLQLARQFPDSYGEAEQFFREVIAHPSADPDTRVEAKMGLGLLWEKLADEKKGSERTELLERALGEFLEIFNRVYTAENVSERPAPHWISKAGLEAARVAESDLQLWAQAANVYQRLIEGFPVLEPRLKPKLADLSRKIPPE